MRWRYNTIKPYNIYYIWKYKQVLPYRQTSQAQAKESKQNDKFATRKY